MDSMLIFQHFRLKVECKYLHWFWKWCSALFCVTHRPNTVLFGIQEFNTILIITKPLNWSTLLKWARFHFEPKRKKKSYPILENVKLSLKTNSVNCKLLCTHSFNSFTTSMHYLFSAHFNIPTINIYSFLFFSLCRDTICMTLAASY